ncbi:MAG: hypothetical protein WDA16_13410 [Candidatus Thermoplasmatota archaeon]
MRLPGLLLAIALLAIGGCFGPKTSPIAVHAYLPLSDAQPGRGTEFAFFLKSESPFKQDLSITASDLPKGWVFEPETTSLDIGGDKTTSLIVRITPHKNATYGPQTLGVMVGDTRSEITVNVRDLGREPLRSGIGTTLTYVLWYDNGTAIETNEHVAADQAGLVFAPSNDARDYTPLKVYVGGTRGTPPPEPYNSTGCDGSPPPCYHPVITGFDARLRDTGNGQGMVQGETLAVRIPKEQAYGYAGNDAHPLFNENLNFLIRIVSVDIYNAKSCALPVCV